MNLPQKCQSSIHPPILLLSSSNPPPSILQSSNPPILQSCNSPILQSSNPAILQSSNPPILQSSNPPNLQSLQSFKTSKLLLSPGVLHQECMPLPYRCLRGAQLHDLLQVHRNPFDFFLLQAGDVSVVFTAVQLHLHHLSLRLRPTILCCLGQSTARRSLAGGKDCFVVISICATTLILPI
jgi:hypothetical protein